MSPSRQHHNQRSRSPEGPLAGEGLVLLTTPLGGARPENHPDAAAPIRAGSSNEGGVGDGHTLRFPRADEGRFASPSVTGALWAPLSLGSLRASPTPTDPAARSCRPACAPGVGEHHPHQACPVVVPRQLSPPRQTRWLDRRTLGLRRELMRPRPRLAPLQRGQSGLPVATQGCPKQPFPTPPEVELACGEPDFKQRASLPLPLPARWGRPAARTCAQRMMVWKWAGA